MNSLVFGDWVISVADEGAELQSILYKKKEYLYQKIPSFWQRQSPILFPIVGRLSNDSYIHEGKTYQLPQHGFVRNMTWSSIKNDRENVLEFVVSSNTETKELYPWDFELHVLYSLDVTTLHVEYKIINLSPTEMPCSIGGHPAFGIEGDLRHYKIHFEADDGLIDHDILDTIEKGLLSGHIGTIKLENGTLSLDENLFSSDALIFRDLHSNYFHFIKNGKKIFTFSKGNFPHFALWKEPNAPYLCFEPWQGHADGIGPIGEILDKEGIVVIQSGESRSFSWSLSMAY